MKKYLFGLLPLLTLTAAQSAFSANHDPQAIAALLPQSTISLLNGIALAERTSGVATSAKYEVDGSKLMLSVYTIPEGISTPPAMATLTELSGVATEGSFGFSSEVFSDKEHIATASQHLVLFQLSRYSLTEIIQKAMRKKQGTPIDVRNPTVRDRRPVADVVLLDRQNVAFMVEVDLQSGCTTLRSQ